MQKKPSKKRRLRILTAFFLISLFSGCVSNKDALTPFPKTPDFKIYSSSPVVRYKGSNEWIVSEELIENSLKQHIYIRFISEWKEKNGIR